jgi:hypothetical protein
MIALLFMKRSPSPGRAEAQRIWISLGLQSTPITRLEFHPGSAARPISLPYLQLSGMVGQQRPH